MNKIIPITFKKDNFEIAEHGIVLSSCKELYFKDIQTIEIQPSWGMFFGATNNIIISLNDSEKINLYNIEDPLSKVFVERLHQENPQVQNVTKSPFIFTRPSFIPDIVLPNLFAWLF